LRFASRDDLKGKKLTTPRGFHIRGLERLENM
jgi:hypothetical protein